MMRNVRATGPVLYQNTNGGSALRGSVGDLVASINNGASIRNVITKLGVAAWMDSVQVVLNICRLQCCMWDFTSISTCINVPKILPVVTKLVTKSSLISRESRKTWLVHIVYQIFANRILLNIKGNCLWRRRGTGYMERQSTGGPSQLRVPGWRLLVDDELGHGRNIGHGSMGHWGSCQPRELRGSPWNGLVNNCIGNSLWWTYWHITRVNSFFLYRDGIVIMVQYITLALL